MSEAQNGMGEFSENKKLIQIEISTKNEATAAPYWLILDPRQNMRSGVHDLASQITGPFFSREAAEAHLQGRRYAFGKNAVVYCHSGYWSREYLEACQKSGVPT